MANNTVFRIKLFIDYKRLSVRKFEKLMGFSNGSFASQFKNNKTIGVDKVENILHTFQELSPQWLLTGEGAMLKGENAELPEQPKRDFIECPKCGTRLELIEKKEVD